MIQCDESSVCSTVQKVPEAQEDSDDDDGDVNKPADCCSDSKQTHTHSGFVCVSVTASPSLERDLSAAMYLTTRCR